MRIANAVLAIAILLCGCSSASSDSAAMTKVYQLVTEAEENPAVIYVPAWNKEWVDTWNRVYQSTDSADLRQAAAWCIAFAETKAAADINTCVEYIKSHNQSPTAARSIGTYVTTDSPVVYSAPDSPKGICRLQSGLEVIVTEWKDGWASITNAPCSGWVRGDYITAKQ